jgi:tetratricopeptide (TPR) repeat protein
MPRAFLSYSTDDQEYVAEVATLLGRYQANVDFTSFRPGEDFRDAIRRTLDLSQVFVFFVSPTSLSSSWVQFELGEAEMRARRGILRSGLAIFIGDAIDRTKLPAWLERVRAVRHITPGQSARTIESMLLASSADHQKPFIGRHEDLQRGVRKLATDNPPRRIVIVSGLDGVGRRSYLARLLEDALNLDLGPIIVLPAEATIEDLFVGSQLASMMLTQAEAEAQLGTFRALNARQQGIEVADQLAFLARQGAAPCIVDRGAMLDSSGRYLDSYADVLTRFLNERDVYLAVVHTRFPDFRHLHVRSQLLERRLKPLDPPDAQALIMRLLRQANINAEPDQAARLADAVRGYPPAAYYLVSEVETYGIDLVLNDASRMADFHSQSFSLFLRGLKLSPVEREILQYLSSETRLDLPGISVATAQTIEETARAIGQLVDLSLVEMLDGEYSVTAPIQATVMATEPGLGRRWYEAAFQRLETEFWSDKKALPPISVVDATLRAGLRVGRHGAKGYSGLVRPSLLIHAAHEMYHRGRYDRALEYTDRAEQMGGLTAQLLEIRVKSLAQLQKFPQARRALAAYREMGERRKWFLGGFVERKAGDHTKACSRFQQGYARGDRSVSLLRDYADSLLRTDAVGEAGSIAREALDRARGDLYVLDLIARIEIAAGTKDDAEAALQALEVVDVQHRFIRLRRASFLLDRVGTTAAVRRAIELAEQAISARNDAPIATHLVLARALTRAKRWERLNEVKDEIARRRHKDGKALLRELDLDAAILAGDWRRGEKLLPYFMDTAVNRELRAAILDLKSADRSVSLTERQDAETEASALRKGWVAVQRPVQTDIDLYE